MEASPANWLLKLAPWACLLLTFSSTAFSQHPKHIYKLESVSIAGSTRLPEEVITQELGLEKGLELSDDIVLQIKQQLLGLGLFRSTLVYMRKGTQPQQARLIIDLEDDPSVLTDWAIGSEIILTQGEPATSSLGSDSTSQGYQFNLVGRNLFKSMHRGSAGVDVDAIGVLREAHLAYGLPRFAHEGTQFDAKWSMVDIGHRYLNANGFGMRFEAGWTTDADHGANIGYGIGIYLNRKRRFDLPEFPNTIMGPKVSYHKESRLLGFIPSEGVGYQASVLISPTATDTPILELGLGGTTMLGSVITSTLESKILLVGIDGYSTRVETRLDLPFGASYKTEEYAKAFLSLNWGKDKIGSTDLYGSAATLGLRYHSSGLIAELAFKITKTPGSFEPLLGKGGVGEY